MKLPILLVTPDQEWGSGMQKQLISFGYETELVINGKDCQIRSSKVKFFAILLDIKIENYSAAEVLKFLKISHPSVKIIMLADNKESLESSSLASKSLQKLGISEILYKPLSFEKVKSKLIALHGISKMADLKNAVPSGEPKKIKDSEVTPISVKEFYSDNVSMFDHYIRLSANNYKKIINLGEHFSAARLKKFEEDGLENFFILTADRMNYINYVNASIQKNLSKQSDIGQASKLILPLKNITSKYMEEVHTAGLNPQLVDEGKVICQNMYDLINKDTKLNSMFSELNEQNPSTLTHSFLVSFFSIYICRQIDWAGRRTVDTIALGALLHDIGLLSLPANFRNLLPSEMTPAQFEAYKQHPKLGKMLLERSNLANESLLQIVLQHHEHLDGSGYPNNISGSKIYPLAKIVSLADFFADALIEHKTTPKETMKLLLKERGNLLKFDPLLMRGLVQGIAS